MKTIIAKYFLLSLIVVVIFTSCEIKKTESGEAPDVAVNSGKLPKYDLDWAKVNVSKRTKTIKVPKVVVVMEEKEVEVPVLDFDMPGDNDEEMEEQTIKVEAEVSESMYDLDIKRVFAKGNRLIVVSELEPLYKSLDGKTVRISDQIIINAPDDLVVKYYIVGKKPAGDFNSSYTFVSTESSIDTNGAQVLYEK